MDAHFQEVSEGDGGDLAQAKVEAPSAEAVTQSDEEKKAAPPDEIDEGAVKGESAPQAPDLQKDEEGLPVIPPSPEVLTESAAKPEEEGV